MRRWWTRCGACRSPGFGRITSWRLAAIVMRARSAGMLPALRIVYGCSCGPVVGHLQHRVIGGIVRPLPLGETATFAPHASWRSGGGVAWDTGEILAAYAWQKFVVKVSR